MAQIGLPLRQLSSEKTRAIDQ